MVRITMLYAIDYLNLAKTRYPEIISLGENSEEVSPSVSPLYFILSAFLILKYLLAALVNGLGYDS